MVKRFSILRQRSLRDDRKTIARRYAALAALAPLTLAACGGGPSSGGTGGGGSGGTTVDSLTVLDYYTDEPGHTQVAEHAAAKCGTSIGVAKIDHQSVPGPTLIQKVLQQASSKTLPDVLMLDNPDIQQIAETGALAPLGDYGINADGYAPGPVSAATYDGQAVRPAAGRQHASRSSTTRTFSTRPASSRRPPGPS